MMALAVSKVQRADSIAHGDYDPSRTAMPKRLIAAFATAVLASVLAAQRPVVTVGGTNPNFLDLPPAIAAAAPGSIIDVRPGTYTGFDCQKALQVVLNGATVLAAPGSLYTIHVHNVLGADPFVLKGINGIVGPGLIGAMRVDNTIAPVVIESVTMSGGLLHPGLDVFNTGVVHVARSVLGGFPALQGQFTNLVTNENVFANTFGPAAIVSDASLDSARTIFIGADQPALKIFDTTARLASDGTGAMLVFGNPTVPISAFEASDSTVFWDPSLFSLLPANGAPAFLPVMTTEVIEEIPILNAGPAPLGGVATVRMTMSSSAMGMIAIGFLLPTPIVVGFVGIYPDPASFVLAAAGVVDPAGLMINFPVPSDPALRGTILVFQGLTFLANGSSPISGPALWYVN